MGAERRQFARITHRMVARFLIKGKPAMGVVRNFSEVGLFVQTRHMFRVGSVITLHIGTSDAITLEGKVSRCVEEAPNASASMPGGMGITLMAAPANYLEFVEKMRKTTAKRKTPEERFEVYHKVSFESEGAFLTEYTENLSRGGMYLTTKEPLKLDSTIRAR